MPLLKLISFVAVSGGLTAIAAAFGCFGHGFKADAKWSLVAGGVAMVALGGITYFALERISPATLL